MLLSTLLENTVMAAGLAAVVAVVCRFNRARPALCHMLWLLVFAVLIMPPLPVGFGGGGLRGSVSNLLSPTPEPSTSVYAAPAWGGKSLGAARGGEDSGAVLSGLASAKVQPTFAEALRAPSTATSLGLGEWFTGVSARTWLLGFWSAGSLVILAFMHRRISRFHRGVKGAGPAPTELVGEVQAVAERLGVQAPEVRLLEGVGSPSVWCFGRARLLWPSKNGAMTSSDLAPSLIAHELAHIARRDTWVSRLEVFAIAACWWHPLFWLIRRQVHAYAELSCDAWALWAYPKQRLVFAAALIGAHEDTLTAPVALQGLCATNSDFKDFERRLKMILNEKVSRSVSKGAAALAIASTVLLLPGQSQDSDTWDGKKYEAECEACDAGKEHVCIDQKVELKQALDAAEKLFRAGDLPQAMDAFENVLRLDPNQSNAHARLAYIQIGLDMTDEARVHLQHAVDHRDNVQIAAYNLACCDALEGKSESGLKHLAKSIRNGFADVNLLASDEDLNGLRGMKGFDAATSLVNIANQLRADLGSKEKRSPKERAALLRSLSRIVSEDGQIASDYAMAIHGLGDYKASLEAFGRQAKLGHNAQTAMYNRGCALAMLGKTDAAFESLFEAANMGMNYPMVADDTDLLSLHSDKRWAKIVDKLSAAQDSMKKVEKAMNSGNLEKATALLERLSVDIAAGAESRGWANLKNAEVLMELGRHKEALASFDRAAAEEYAIDEAAFGMAAAHAALGHAAQVEEKLHAALELGFTDHKRVARLAKEAHLKSAHELAARAEESAKYAKMRKKKTKSIASEAEERYFAESGSSYEPLQSDFTEEYIRVIEEASLVVDLTELHELVELEGLVSTHVEKVEMVSIDVPAEDAAAIVEFLDGRNVKAVDDNGGLGTLGKLLRKAPEVATITIDKKAVIELKKQRLELQKLEIQLEIKRVELEKMERELERATKKAKKGKTSTDAPIKSFTGKLFETF